MSVNSTSEQKSAQEHSGPPRVVIGRVYFTDRSRGVMLVGRLEFRFSPHWPLWAVGAGTKIIGTYEVRDGVRWITRCEPFAELEPDESGREPETESGHSPRRH